MGGSSLTIKSGAILNAKDSIKIKSDAKGTGALLNECGSVIPPNINITVERYLAKFGYHYFSSPISGATLNEINKTVPLVNLNGQYFDPLHPPTAAKFPNIWVMDETHSNPNDATDQAAWKAPSGLNEVMPNMRGYSVIVPKNATTLRINGKANALNCGEISYNLTKGGNGFNFIGNPYTSPIDWSAVRSHLPSDMNKMIVVFSATSYYYGTWGYYDPEIGSYGAYPHNQYIPAMQGFYVHTNKALTLTLTDADRTVRGAAVQSAYYKSGERTTTTTTLPVLRISGSNTNYPDSKDEAIICFKPNAKAKYDDLNDAIKLMNTITEYPNIYVKSDSMKLAFIKHFLK